MSSKSYELAEYIHETVKNLQDKYQDNSSWAKKQLALLRRVANRSIGDSPETWSILYDKRFPESLKGTGQKDPTWGEKAAFFTLTLYAVHQQSKRHGVHVKTGKGSQPQTLGAAVREFHNVTKKDPDKELFDSSIYRRFITMVHSQTIEDAAYHLRSLIKLFRTQDSILLDYSELAKDLYYFQNPKCRKAVQLSWARQLYQSNPSQD
jgi:CRISPR system CASCADE complex protein casB